MVWELLSLDAVVFFMVMSAWRSFFAYRRHAVLDVLFASSIAVGGEEADTQGEGEEDMEWRSVSRSVSFGWLNVQHPSSTPGLCVATHRVCMVLVWDGYGSCPGSCFHVKGWEMRWGRVVLQLE